LRSVTTIRWFPRPAALPSTSDSPTLPATTIVAIPLPVGAVVVGGYVSRTEAFDAASYNITIGDADDDNRYLAEADLKAVGTTALLTPGYIGTGQDIEVIFEAADVCTTGEAIIVVEYIVDGRADEVQVA
jgi:hypothetical protein